MALRRICINFQFDLNFLLRMNSFYFEDILKNGLINELKEFMGSDFHTSPHHSTPTKSAK